MSVIFPTSPSQVRVHLLPKKAEMITYRVDDTIKISAWMPDKFHRIQQKTDMSNDEFYNSFCEGCERNCYSFIEAYYDEDIDDIDWDHPDLHGHCDVYNDGYHGQSCPHGYEKEGSEIEFDVSNMVFEIHLTHLGETPRFVYSRDTAYLQAGRYNELHDDETPESENYIDATIVKMASNVFGYDEAPEGICWGYNRKPKNLREMVTYFFNTPFNNDLVKLDEFEKNCDEIRCSVYDDYFDVDNVYENDKFIGSQIDALMMVDAEEDQQAFYTMLMAGFKPIPEAPHVMMIPLYEYEFEKNEKYYRGFKTAPDDVNREWFVMSDTEYRGLLLGQI